VAAQMSGEVRDERTNLVGFGVDARCVKCQAARWASISAGPLAEPVPSTPHRAGRDLGRGRRPRARAEPIPAAPFQAACPRNAWSIERLAW
jgi:hypothetical protein